MHEHGSGARRLDLLVKEPCKHIEAVRIIHKWLAVEQSAAQLALLLKDHVIPAAAVNGLSSLAHAPVLLEGGSARRNHFDVDRVSRLSGLREIFHHVREIVEECIAVSDEQYPGTRSSGFLTGF